jgi:16S rRNA (cytosine1402-N4)-methyltransferase
MPDGLDALRRRSVRGRVAHSASSRIDVVCMTVPPTPAPRSVHTPVMLREVLQHLALQPGLVVLDGTVGGGGHSRKILEAIGPEGRLIGLDRDAGMLTKANTVLGGAHVILVHDSYAQARTVLDRLGIERVDRILVDLGLSSDQLADASRGFSFDATGPLDLRFDVTTGKPAWKRLAEWDEAELQNILLEYGEEPHNRRIAAAIVAQRADQPIRTARDLAELVARVVGSKGNRDRHPATRTFQALRIAVNRELDQLTEALHTTFPACLKTGGLLVVISFHSLEDRLVKEAFRERSTLENLTPKPLEPLPAEVRFNPRSRSAKLRVARRIKDT